MTNDLRVKTAEERKERVPLRYPLRMDVLEGGRRRWGFLLGGYVLMPDHWHALIWPRSPLSISPVVHDVKKVAARRLHAPRGTEGPVWQHPFWDRLVRHEKEFAARLDYLHYNPVRKELVERPEAWRWSSYKNFALDRKTVADCPIQIDYLRLPLGYRG
jgi:REP-associated tyrosine transposase